MKYFTKKIESSKPCSLVNMGGNCCDSTSSRCKFSTKTILLRVKKVGPLGCIKTRFIIKKEVRIYLSFNFFLVIKRYSLHVAGTRLINFKDHR